VELKQIIPLKRDPALGGKKQGLIFVISGPSGSGKTTLLQNLIRSKILKHKLVKSVSFTTRPKRSGEREGRDYFFISDHEFKQRRKAKKILEWTRYLGYYYATPKDFVERRVQKGRHILLCLDLKGAFRIKRLYSKNTVTIFVMPPSLRTLHDRIKKRCSRTKREEIRQRLWLARKELGACRRYDYCVLNKDLRQAVRETKIIITRCLKG
jgi:guanylate kinase